MASDKKRERYWRELIGRQRASGQTVAGFCRQAGVSDASFYTWRRRLHANAASVERNRRPNSGKEEARAPMASLVPVQVVADPNASDTTVEIHLPGAVMLRISPGCDEQTVRMVLAALASQAAGGSRRC
jgi:transposase-like protein